MTKRKIIYFMVLLILMGGAVNLFSQGPGIDFKVGLDISLNTAPIKINNIKNSLNYSYLALAVDADVTDFLTLGVLAGFSSNHFKNPVIFEQLPLSLQFDREKYKALVLGLTAASEFSLFGDFSLKAGGRFLYFTPFKKESVITLPIVRGEAISKCPFYQVDIELLGQYDGFSTITIFLGPQLFLAKGKYKASETIEVIKDDETLTFKQKNIFGIVGGLNFDLGDHINLDLRATLISKTVVSARIMYVF